MAPLLLPLKHHLNLLKKARIKRQKTNITSVLEAFANKQLLLRSPSPSVFLTLRKLRPKLSSYLLVQLADSESSPLTWWKVHEENFPVIGRQAKKYLCIPATSTASERVFSAGGNVVTCQLSLLKSATVNMLVFLTKNLKV